MLCAALINAIVSVAMIMSQKLSVGMNTPTHLSFPFCRNALQKDMISFRPSHLETRVVVRN